MGDTHSFNTALAAEIGIVPAIVFHYMRYWVYINIINGENFVEGRHWTYNTMNAIQKHFGYMSVNTISRAVSKLIEKGFLIDGCYNKNPYDKTKWYTLSDMALARYPFTDFAKTQIATEKNDAFESTNLGEAIPIITNYNKEEKENISNNINIIPNIKEKEENPKSTDFDNAFYLTAEKIKKDPEVAYNLRNYKVKDIDSLLTAFKKHITKNFRTGDFLKQNYMQNRKWLFNTIGNGLLDMSAATGRKLGPGEMIDEDGRRYYIHERTGNPIYVPDDARPRPGKNYVWVSAYNDWITP